MTVDRRWIIGLIVALTLSLAANLVVAGLILAHRGPPPPFNMGSPSAVEGLFGELSPAGQEIVRETMRAARRDMRETVETLREARREVRRLMEAETLDKAALATTLERVRRLGDAVEQRMEAAFVEAAGQLSPEDRKRFRPGRSDGGRSDGGRGDGGRGDGGRRGGDGRGPDGPPPPPAE
ncbi:periplasmic heavy metal sensor [Zavarzinia compransoris]|uniref:Periplasmic heavy metal sensor n=1 Tax=Zavarzinia compransoris TaxID=1264899 RepID=A0A317DVX6_9PROT|nr:periplasmic heavy metal sensor [Zavarzinia compransoris]PWR18026.1 hypothetical protein DKG75_21035 [Zavarzinia compransoris]TDP43508.1 putative membrane protein [Zavarzinia compransoris]